MVYLLGTNLGREFTSRWMSNAIALSLRPSHASTSTVCAANTKAEDCSRRWWQRNRLGWNKKPSRWWTTSKVLLLYAVWGIGIGLPVAWLYNTSGSRSTSLDQTRVPISESTHTWEKNRTSCRGVNTPPRPAILFRKSSCATFPSAKVSSKI